MIAKVWDPRTDVSGAELAKELGVSFEDILDLGWEMRKEPEWPGFRDVFTSLVYGGDVDVRAEAAEEIRRRLR